MQIELVRFRRSNTKKWHITKKGGLFSPFVDTYHNDKKQAADVSFQTEIVGVKTTDLRALAKESHICLRCVAAFLVEQKREKEKKQSIN